jgi:hypothetical protein
MPRADRVDVGGCAHTGEVMDDRLPPAPARPADADDDFSGPKLRTDLWVDHYLPHWTTPERSLARYDLIGNGLRLRIDADQPT